MANIFLVDNFRGCASRGDVDGIGKLANLNFFLFLGRMARCVFAALVANISCKTKL